MTQDATDTSINTPILTLSRIETQSFLKAVDCVRHTLPDPTQKDAQRHLYAYHVDRGPAGGYVTATDGYRASRWAFFASTKAPAFCGPVAVADVEAEAYCKERHGAVSLTPVEGISYPDVSQAVRKAMQGAVWLGRITRITLLLRVVSAFERFGFASIKIDFQGADVHIMAEDKEVGIKASIPNAIEGNNAIEGDGARKVCYIEPDYLSGALRAIERGKLNNSEVAAELSPRAIRLTVMNGSSMAGEELIMRRQ
jgi:hypothetical protein